MFFRQGSPGRSVGGASHTRHLCGNKRRKGGSPSSRRACAIFIARTTPACYSNSQPFGLSVNRPGPTIVCGSEPTPPFSSNTRKQAGFLIFFLPRGFFFFLYHFSSSRSAESKFVGAILSRAVSRDTIRSHPRRGHAAD